MKKRETLKLLGTIDSYVVGMQYYETMHRVGDILYFDRNPYNEYDNNAIEVSNKRGLLGHIKRQNTVWLGQLIDEGRIFLKGKITDESDNWRIPVKIEVYQTKKGKSVISPVDPDSPESVIHNHLLDILKKSDSYSRETILGLREYYKGIIYTRDIMPETTLVFKLLKSKTVKNRQNELKILIDNAQAYFNALEYGKPVRSKIITVVPLLKRGSAKPRYVSGEKALKDKTLIIEETGTEGEVSRLRATNRGDKPVILISGEGLKGAKQDRIVNVTIIIEANKSVDIPVSCVEHGRWSYKKDSQFKPAHFATQSIRQTVREEVNRKISGGVKSYDSDQNTVWQGVAETASKHKVKSDTGNLNEVYHSKRSEIAKILSKIKYVKDAVGVAIFANGRQVSVELFQEKTLMRRNWKKIMQSVIIDEYHNTEEEEKAPALPVIRKQLKEFFNNVCSTASEPEISPGRGDYVISRNNRLEAGALFDNGNVVHLSGVLSE